MLRYFSTFRAFFQFSLLLKTVFNSGVLVQCHDFLKLFNSEFTRKRKLTGAREKSRWASEMMASRLGVFIIKRIKKLRSRHSRPIISSLQTWNEDTFGGIFYLLSGKGTVSYEFMERWIGRIEHHFSKRRF